MSFILNFSFWMCSRLHANDCKRGRNAIKIPVLSQSTVVRPSSAPFSFSLYAGGSHVGVRALGRCIDLRPTDIQPYTSGLETYFPYLLPRIRKVPICSTPRPCISRQSTFQAQGLRQSITGTRDTIATTMRHHYPFVQLLFHATAGNYVVGTARQLKKISF